MTVCGLDELVSHADRQVSHVLSILDPGWEEPEAFGAYGEHARLQLHFNDDIEDIADRLPPSPEHVQQIIEFGRDMLRDPEALRHLLVHCHAGVSRSTAAMTLILASVQPELSAEHVLDHILYIRAKAWPNLRILTLGEQQLGRSGEFTSAVAKVYRHQLERKPELKDYFIAGGRGREVELALSGVR